MSAQDTEKFLNDLKLSSIAESTEVDQWLAITQSLNNPQKLADQLVDLGHLTRWQANYLLSGRTRLRFGNYVLMDRLRRDELGDAFIGRHQQLDRQVNMLFLSKEISARLNQNSTMIERLAKAADIVHPNLEHVHLIDRDSGRFMLVTDHIPGRSLDESEQMTLLRPADLPQILGQLIDAISAAHRSGLTHGGLSEKAMFLDADGKLTLTGFLVSFLHDGLVEATADQTVDIQAIALIGRRLMARLSASDRGNTVEHVRQIINQLAESKIDLATASAMLAQIEHKENLKTHNQVAAASSGPGAARRGSASSAQPDVTRPIPKIAGEAKENRRPRRIAIAISALMLLATLWFLGQQFWVGGEVANRGSLGDQTTSANEQLPSLPRIVDELAADGKSSNPADRKITERKSSNDSNANSDTEATATDRPGSESAAVTDTKYVKNSDPKMVLPSPEPEPRETEEPASLLKAFNAMKSQSSESTEPIGTSSSDRKTLSESASRETEGDKQAARDSTDGSRKIPATVDLPVISTVSPISLFGLPDNETGDLNLELLSDENISKAKTGFEISGNANRGWTVQLIDPHDSTKTPTAVFRLAGSDLEFSWLPDSQQIPAAEYLRNCVLKCVAANSVHHIPLRSPVTIAEFVLDREENVTRIDLPELQFLPQNAIARLDKLDEEIHGITYLPDGREDRSVDRRSPLEVHFSELPEYQMVFLVLQADLKNRSRLEASVHLKLDPRQKSKPVSEKSLDGASQWLQQHFESVKLNHDNLKAMPIDELRRRLGVSSSQFKNAQKLAKVKELALQMEFSEKRAKSFREMRTQLESFYGKPIPVTVAFEVEGIEVILATTAARD